MKKPAHRQWKRIFRKIFDDITTGRRTALDSALQRGD